MKKLIGKLVVCVLAALMAVSFAACSNSKTIEDYVKSSEVQSQITEMCIRDSLLGIIGLEDSKSA